MAYIVAVFYRCETNVTCSGHNKIYSIATALKRWSKYAVWICSYYSSAYTELIYSYRYGNHMAAIWFHHMAPIWVPYISHMIFPYASHMGGRVQTTSMPIWCPYCVHIWCPYGCHMTMLLGVRLTVSYIVNCRPNSRQSGHVSTYVARSFYCLW